MLTSNADMVLRYMFPDAKEGDWQLSDMSDGNGIFISAWNREEPIPSNDEINSHEAESLVAQEAAKWTPAILQAAGMFRALLRKHFGPDAETNHDITQAMVQGYFATAQNLSGDDVRDGIFLDRLYAQLSPLCPDGTTWTFPWEKLP